MIALMVGGPVHGEAWEVPDPPPWVLMVPRAREWWIEEITSDCVMPMPEPHTYNLRRLNPNLRAPRPLSHAYLCVDEPEHIHPVPIRDDEEALYTARLAANLWLQACEDALPGCIVPGCTRKGRYRFEAAEHGRFAGRWWRRGDEIRLCPAHGDDVYRAQGMYGLDQLPDWLKPDVMLDPLDAIGMGAWADEIYRSRGRAMRLKANDGNRGRP